MAKKVQQRAQKIKEEMIIEIANLIEKNKRGGENI